MARILFPTDETWYDELKVISSYYEAELENTILSHVETVFPNYITIPYKKDVYTAAGGQGRAPDLALINKDYSDWWIVEVELGEHTLDHVKTQIDVFVNGNYNAFEVAKYIKTKDVTGVLNIGNLRTMVGNSQPKVLVIVDEHDANWKTELETLGALMCVFQVFKSKAGHRAYRLNGHYPFIFENNSHCRFIKSPPNMLEIIDPTWFIAGLEKTYVPPTENSNIFSKKFWRNKLNLNKTKPIAVDYFKDRELDIDFLGKVSKWKVIKGKTNILLKAIGVNKVDVSGTYMLYSDTDFKLYLKPN